MSGLAVIIPVFNKADYLDRCISSMIIQSELNEICLIDDGSTDGSLDIIKSCMSQDSRVRLLQHENQENKGRSASRNLGIKSTSCEWISFCDADDYYGPDRYKAFSALEKDHIDGTHELVISEYSDNVLQESIDAKTCAPVDFATPQELQNYLISNREKRISIISLIIKKSKIEEAGYFDESLKTGEDTDLIWRLAGISNLRYIDQDSPKVFRQVHADNSYQNKDTLNENRFSFYKKWNDFKDNINLSQEAIARINTSYEHYSAEVNPTTILNIKRVVRKLKNKLS